MAGNWELINGRWCLIGEMGQVLARDGVTPHIGENGNWWIGDEDTGVSTTVGEKGDEGPEGPAGAPGKDGYTPVKGVDYFTEEDKTELVEEVVARALPVTSAADAGKFLRVDANGKWVAESVQDAEEVAY